MALRKKGKYWYLYYRQGRKIVYKSLRTMDENEALRNSNAIMAQVRYARHMGAVSNLLRELSINSHDVEISDKASRIESLPEQFVVPVNSEQKLRLPLDKALETASLHRKIGKEHEYAFNAFAKATGLQYMDEITQAIALKYLDDNFGDASPKRYNNVLTLLNVVCRSCLVEAGITTSPFASLMPRLLDDVEHYREFTKEESAAILAALKGHDYWYCVSFIAYHTGLRYESCTRLCPSMIDEDMITIMPGKTSRYGRAVQIPVTKELDAYLNGIRCDTPDTPYCKAFKMERYLAVNGKRMYFFAGVLASLGIHDIDGELVGFPSWRDTYATRISEEGVPDRVMRGILGHTKQRMTDLYNHDTESARRQKANIEKALEIKPDE